MHVARHWYLETDPNVYKNNSNKSLQQQLDDAVAKEIALALKKDQDISINTNKVTVNKKKVIDLCYSELNKSDYELMEQNRIELEQTQDTEKFFEAEKKRTAKFKQDLADILEMIELFEEKGI